MIELFVDCKIILVENYGKVKMFDIWIYSESIRYNFIIDCILPNYKRFTIWTSIKSLNFNILKKENKPLPKMLTVKYYIDK